MSEQPDRPDRPDPSAKAFWEDRYAEPGRDGRVWSGRVNHALEQLASTYPAGRALDLGCGEGGDSVWLAQQGWTVVGADISELALERAAAAADERGLGDRITWVSADLTTWTPEAEFDLVSACFFQSPMALPRYDILRRVATSIVPGGRLLSVSHASVPPWSRAAHELQAAQEGHEHGHGHGPMHLPTAAEEVESLGLAGEGWSVEVAEDRPREVTGPEGRSATIHDAVVVLRRD